MAASQIILPRFILPVRPERAVLSNHAVVLDDGLVHDILPRSEAIKRFPDAPRLELDRHVLMPGLVNMHTHSPMSLFRGYADDVSLDQWLRKYIWPAEVKHVGEEFVRQGTELAMAEMLRGGVTCFNEMYFFPDVIADAAVSVGMRACIGLPVIEQLTPWADDVEECFAKASVVHERLLSQELIQTSLAPHSLYTVSESSLDRLAEMSGELAIPVYMHVLEIAWETEHSKREYGITPLARLDGHGLLGESFLAVHMAHLTDEDVALVASSGTHVIHCPESNLKLASGICPVTALLASGVNVCLGTDGAASNNDLDLLGEMRTAALLAKGFSGDARVVDAWQSLDMVTINAAKALGLEDQIGSIEPGKRADLCALDLDYPQTQPVHNVASQVAYAASSTQFTDAWVNGKRLLANGELTTIDMDRTLANARNWAVRMEREAN